jgi:hypothetical protein
MAIMVFLSCVFFCTLGAVCILYLHYFWMINCGPPSPLSSNKSSIKSFPHSGKRLGALQLLIGSNPLCNSFINLIISLHYNYEEVTATECVNTNSSQWPTNYVPSVSACIGVSFPQEPLSHAGVTFQQWYRVLMSVAMYIHYQKLFKGTAPLTNRTRLALSFLENVVLIGGTSVTSTESIEWHEVFCGLYFVFHTFTMALTIVMTKYKLNHLEQSNNVLHVKDRNIRQRQQHTEKAYSLRIRLFQFWCFCLCFMVFFFATAKGSMCTVNGWYSMFAIFEWLTLWTGFSFDCLEYLDLYDVSLMLVED